MNKAKQLLLVWLTATTLQASMIETQLFEPATGNMRFLSIESAQRMAAGEWHLGIFSDVASNSLPRFEQATGPNEWELESGDRIWNVHILTSIGLSKTLSANLQLSTQPFLDIRDDQATAPSIGTIAYRPTHALTRAGASLKWGIVQSEYFALALLTQGGVYFQDQNPFWGGTASEGQEPLAYGSGDVLLTFGKKLQLALQAGYGWRDLSSSNVTSLGRGLGRGLGRDFAPSPGVLRAKMGLAYGDNVAVLLEAYSYLPQTFNGWNLDRSELSIEILFGVRKAWADHSQAFAAIASEADHGLGTADYRAIFGFQWNLRQPRPELPAPKEIPALVAAAKPAPQKARREPNPLIDQPDYKVVLKNIRFDSGSTALKLDDSLTLSELQKSLELIQQKDPRLVVLEGHTDSVGSAENNLRLSKQRAESVRTYLLQNGATGRLITYGYGQSEPIANNSSAEGRAKNRRVELLFYP